MAADPSLVIVEPGVTTQCVKVHHAKFPDLRADGENSKEAAVNLATDFDREIEGAADDLHRDPLRQALADVRAFLGQTA